MATSPRLEDTTYYDPVTGAAVGTAAIDNSGVRTSTTAAATTSSTWTDSSPLPTNAATPSATSAVITPPANAAAAPTKTTFTGLCAALNAWQKSLVTLGQRSVADQYEIKFLPAGVIGNAKISKPGGTVQKNTSMNLDLTAKNKLEPATNSVNSNSFTVPITAGTQIVQFIDEVIKSSSYITDQASIIIDQQTGKMKPNANAKNGQVAWYKINVAATPIGYDDVIKDRAYKMTFLITPYALSELESEYFPQTNFRGLHKSYNYWFTGQNTQVLHFEQDYNMLFRQVFTAKIAPGASKASDSRDFYQRTWAVASSESSKGAENAANEVGANAADWLYSPKDFVTIKLKIVGDPAWMQQGEVSQGVNPSNFTFKPFLDDGTINFDSSQICFDLSWNAPADYNLNTGVADVTVNNVNKSTTNLPQENFTYQLIECTNTFSKGRFEQELVGKLVINPALKTTATSTANIAAGTGATTATGAATTDNAGVRAPNTATGTDTAAAAEPTPQSVTPATSAESPQASAPQPLPASTVTPATSNGGITGTSTLAPLSASSTSQLSDQATSALATQAAAEKAYFAAGSPQSGPIYNAYNAALNATDQAQNQLENAVYNTPGAKPVTPAPLIIDPATGRITGSVPQVMAKDQ